MTNHCYIWYNMISNINFLISILFLDCVLKLVILWLLYNYQRLQARNVHPVISKWFFYITVPSIQYEYNFNCWKSCNPSATHDCRRLRQKLSRSWWRMAQQNWNKFWRSRNDMSSILDLSVSHKIICNSQDRFVVDDPFHMIGQLWDWNVNIHDCKIFSNYNYIHIVFMVQ